MARPTIASIAERSGYSVATVSRALHDDASVVAETRDHVLRISRELGYQPSIAGRRLSWGDKAVVGLSLGAHDHAAGRFVALMHQALSSQLSRSGWSVELIAPEDFSRSLDIGGLILVGIAANDPRLRSSMVEQIPTVAIGHDLDCFCVAADDRHGGQLAAQHLIQSGRRKLAVLHARHEGSGPVLRVEAFIAAATAAGHAPQLIEAAPSATPSLEGYRALTRLLKTGAPFDALFCETDEHAIGALAAIEDAGLAVPGDIAVVGFDDLPDLAAHITTIHQDFPKLAEAAIKLLAEARRGTPPRKILIPIELIQRQTT